MLPVLIDTDVLFLPTYLVINSLGFSLAVVWAYKRAKQFSFNQNNILDLALVIMISGFIGARLLHIAWEQPALYFANPVAVIEFWQGGFVFYGGAISAFFAAVIFAKRQRFDWKQAADICAPVFALGYAIGRLGCFAAGCCYGKPAELPWAVTFPSGIPVHPTQLYSSFWDLLAVGILLIMERKGTMPRMGQKFGFWLVWHGVGRLIMEKFRDDFRGPTMSNLSLGTVLSFVVMVFGIYLLINSKKENHAPTSVSNLDI